MAIRRVVLPERLGSKLVRYMRNDRRLKDLELSQHGIDEALVPKPEKPITISKDRFTEKQLAIAIRSFDEEDSM